MAYGLEVAERQYDAQYPENEMPAELVCSMCSYTEKRENTYTVDGEIMCEGCFDDFCTEKFDEHGEDFFADHTEEYAQKWFEQLDSSGQRDLIYKAFVSHMHTLPVGYEKDCEKAKIKRFCTRHGDWKYYIMRVECVKDNKE